MTYAAAGARFAASLRVARMDDRFSRLGMAQWRSADRKATLLHPLFDKRTSMANPFRYYVELRNSSGTTLGTHVIAHSSYAAMQIAGERNPGYRPLFARRLH